MTREEISRETAKELVDEAAFGFLVIGDAEPKPTLGTVPLDELEYEISVETYRFGTEADSE